MAISQNFPSIAPSLSLNFASSRTLDPRITFTRTSSATCVGPNGLLRVVSANEPRFDHNPVTGESLGLLVEEQRTNLLLRSEEADSPLWNIPNSSITVDPNVTVSPDGSQTADKVKEATTTGGHTIEFTGFAFQSGTIYTVSFYAKAAERSRFRVTWPISFTNRLAFVDISPGGYGVISDGGTVTSVSPAGNDWFRVVSTSTCTTTTAGARAGITLVDTGTNVNYTGDGTSGIYLWGAQLEAGAFPTSYIPTTTAAVTRSADLASITGSAFSGWYRQDEGTVFAEYSNQATAGQDRRIFNTSDATGFTTNGSSLFLSNGAQAAASLNTFVGGVNIGAIHSSTPLVVGVVRKTAYSIQVNSRVLVVGGAAPLISSSSYTPPSNIVSADLGQNNGSSSVNGTIRRLIYWPVRLGNNVLQQITQ